MAPDLKLSFFQWHVFKKIIMIIFLYYFNLLFSSWLIYNVIIDTFQPSKLWSSFYINKDKFKIIKEYCQLLINKIYNSDKLSTHMNVYKSSQSFLSLYTYLNIYTKHKHAKTHVATCLNTHINKLMHTYIHAHK